MQLSFSNCQDKYTIKKGQCNHSQEIHTVLYYTHTHTHPFEIKNLATLDVTMIIYTAFFSELYSLSCVLL